MSQTVEEFLEGMESLSLTALTEPDYDLLHALARHAVETSGLIFCNIDHAKSDDPCEFCEAVKSYQAKITKIEADKHD